jgi:hypothetical protein
MPDSIAVAHRIPGLAVSAAVAAWFVGMATLGATGALRAAPSLGPLSALQVSILLPIALFALALRIWPGVRDYCGQLDATWLVGCQVLRILGASHLVSWGLGMMAGAFALPVGLGNTGVALYALGILPRVARRDAGWERLARRLSYFGLAEFGMTIGLAVAGMLATPLPWDPPMATGRYASVVLPPVSLFPTFLIPLFSIIHLATFARLRAGRDERPAPMVRG